MFTYRTCHSGRGPCSVDIRGTAHRATADGSLGSRGWVRGGRGDLRMERLVSGVCFGQRSPQKYVYAFGRKIFRDLCARGKSLGDISFA